MEIDKLIEKAITPEIQTEIHFNSSENFTLVQYIYMGMGVINNHRVCISVGYKINYCLKKALQFTQNDANVIFTHINKVKIGETQECKKFLVRF